MVEELNGAVPIGYIIRYKLTVTNPNEKAPIHNFVVVDELPTHLELVGGSINVVPATNAHIIETDNANEIRVVLTTLEADVMVYIYFDAKVVGSNEDGQIVNVARIHDYELDPEGESISGEMGREVNRDDEIVDVGVSKGAELVDVELSDIKLVDVELADIKLVDIKLTDIEESLDIDDSEPETKDEASSVSIAKVETLSDVAETVIENTITIEPSPASSEEEEIGIENTITIEPSPASPEEEEIGIENTIIIEPSPADSEEEEIEIENTITIEPSPADSEEEEIGIENTIEIEPSSADSDVHEEEGSLITKAVSSPPDEQNQSKLPLTGAIASLSALAGTVLAASGLTTMSKKKRNGKQSYDSLDQKHEEEYNEISWD